MDGYKVDPERFRALLDHAELTPAGLAEAVGCSPDTIRNFCRQHPHRPGGHAAAEPSRDLAEAILAALSPRFERRLTVTDIATAVPSRWRPAS